MRIRMRIANLPPFRIFVSSPVDGIAKYRAAIMDSALEAIGNGRLEFFFYEYCQNPALEGKTVCECIFAEAGHNFDAIFVFFKDRVGSGTREELDYFEKIIIPLNPACQVWWSQIYNKSYPDDVTKFVKHLTTKYNTGLPAIPGKGLNKSAQRLKGRLTSKLLKVVAGI